MFRYILNSKVAVEQPAFAWESLNFVQLIFTLSAFLAEPSSSTAFPALLTKPCEI